MASNNNGNWSYDMFEGFISSNSSWGIAGSYQIKGSYERESETFDDPLKPSTKIDRKEFTLPFSIYVEGDKLYTN